MPVTAEKTMAPWFRHTASSDWPILCTRHLCINSRISNVVDDGCRTRDQPDAQQAKKVFVEALFQ